MNGNRWKHNKSIKILLKQYLNKFKNSIKPLIKMLHNKNNELLIDEGRIVEIIKKSLLNKKKQGITNEDIM